MHDFSLSILFYFLATGDIYATTEVHSLQLESVKHAR